MKATVKCDNGCGWSMADQDPKDWHNRPCPQCQGKRPIVNDLEAIAASVIGSFLKVGLLRQKPQEGDVVKMLDTNDWQLYDVEKTNENDRTK